MSQVPYVQDWTQVLKEIQFDQVVCHFHSTSYWPNCKYFGNLWCMRTLWDGYHKDHAAHKPSGSRTYLWQAWKTEREWNGARRKCNGQTDFIPPFPCHALQRKQTEQEDLPSFLLRFPSSLLHKCLIIFSVWCHCTLGTLNRFAATEHFFIIYWFRPRGTCLL